MGSCQCHPVVRCPGCPTKYDLRKRHEKVDPLEALPSSRTPVSRFDTLKSQSTNGNDTFRGFRVSPQFPDDSLSETTKEETSTVNSDNIIRQESNDSKTYDCDTISTKSMKSASDHGTEKDSDLGSEVLSMAYSSSRSDAKDDVRPFYDTLRQDMTSAEQDYMMSINTLEFENMDTFDSSQTSGYFGTISERPYLCSRLGHRQISHTSEDSREILHWKKGNRLGKGTFGTVWLGMMPTGELIAVKQIELIETDPQEAEKEYAKIYQEVSLLKHLNHDNIVGYLGSSYEKDINHIINVFMQYVPGGSLASIIQKFGALEDHIVAIYTRQTLDAVSYLHSSNIVHRDIKSANILLMPEGIIKLIDFGCAKRLAMRMSRSGSNLQKSLKGTPYWMAPEVINETGHGKKSDIWSVGCTVFELLTGKPPWGDREPLAAIYAIGSDEYPVPLLPDTFADDTREFVQLCLIRDKHKRPNAARLLKHIFVKRPASSTSNSSKRWGHRCTASTQDKDQTDN